MSLNKKNPLCNQRILCIDPAEKLSCLCIWYFWYGIWYHISRFAYYRYSGSVTHWSDMHQRASINEAAIASCCCGFSGCYVCVFCFGPRCLGIAIQNRSVERLSERVGSLGIYVPVVEDRRITIEQLSVSIVLELFSLPHQDQGSRVNTKSKLHQTDVFVRDEPNGPCFFNVFILHLESGRII